MTPPPQKHDPRPPYQQAADAIRREIQTGRLKPGQQLPSHRELQERFGVANMTARSALRVLRDEGLIYTVQGRGSFVADKSQQDAGVAEEAAATEPIQAAAVLEALQALSEQIRTMNAEVQQLRGEVDELKSQRP
ncbi:GntR family transcriptional regulator [Streptomyces sp. JJ38]|uniref:GntR family transcriptional regulator n=1 Tax=Streptomyces sp. JJ38 TaxID=2738128 RepID=UPI001C56FE9C|nr:GntR family transcriptional regulator [Streptomyces sp. JJ38]MBW1599728.1 GntR family transcriptional regulator [Streptomyces sp. JJ38]